MKKSLGKLSYKIGQLLTSSCCCINMNVKDLRSLLPQPNVKGTRHTHIPAKKQERITDIKKESEHWLGKIFSGWGLTEWLSSIVKSVVWFIVIVFLIAISFAIVKRCCFSTAAHFIFSPPEINVTETPYAPNSQNPEITLMLMILLTTASHLNGGTSYAQNQSVTPILPLFEKERGSSCG